MIFWIAMAALTAAATAALLAPLFRGRGAAAGAESEIAIYRDQLDEIARDVDRGVLPEAEAKAARTEIARRLLQASESGERAAAAEAPGRRRLAMWLAIVIVPVVCLAGYLVLGEPGAEDRPFASRLTDPAPDDLFARLQIFYASPNEPMANQLATLITEALVEEPGNLQLWQALSLVYLSLRRFPEAIAAYDQYIAVTGQDGDPGAAFLMFVGENIVIANGAVTPEAEAVFQRVLTVDPTNEPARLYVALGMRARGDDAGAAAALLALLADEPAGGADWADFARAELADMGVEAPPAPAPVAEPGTAPTTVLEALGGTPAEALASPMAGFTPEQAAAINEMVNGLALRLLEAPNDPPGWAQLITSYIVLGRIEDAEAALAMARRVLAGNAEGLALVEEAAAPLRETE